MAGVSAPETLLHQTNAQGVALQTASPNVARLKASKKKSRNSSGKLLSFVCCLGRFGAGDVSSRPLGSAVAGIDRGKALLPKIKSAYHGKKCLVLDLDETLVHSSFKPVPNPDYVLPVEIEGTTHHVYVLKRPGVDLFLQRLGHVYEIVVYTASLAKYADPLLDLLDTGNVVQHRLFRQSCICHEGNYVKDLAMLGRDLKQTIIVDNSPASYLFHPDNAIGVSSFIDDPEDKELFYCLPFLESIKDCSNVIDYLHTYPAFLARQAQQHEK